MTITTRDGRFTKAAEITPQMLAKAAGLATICLAEGIAQRWSRANIRPEDQVQEILGRLRDLRETLEADLARGAA